MIPQTSEYALRAVVQLARVGGGPATTEDIAQATKVPPGYLAQVLRSLAKAGILTAQRGTGGGFTLARPLATLSVWDVLEAADAGIGRITSCPLGYESKDGSLCALHSLLDEAVASVEVLFRAASIQDLLDSTHSTRVLCDRPASTPVTVCAPTGS